MGRSSPSLSVVVDGVRHRTFTPGDKVTGTVVLQAKKQEQIKTFKLTFVGLSLSNTTRPYHIEGNHGGVSDSSRRNYSERTLLFHRETTLLSGYTVGVNVYSWPFEYTFPRYTESCQHHWYQCSQHLKGVRPLPPSFHVYTDLLGGEAIIYYGIEAKLVRTLKGTSKASQQLEFYPSVHMPSEPRMITRAFSSQAIASSTRQIDKCLWAWKYLFMPKPHLVRSIPTRGLIPTVQYPEAVTPGHSITLSLLLKSCQPKNMRSQILQCELDSLSVVISTFTRSTCGRSVYRPYDESVEHALCISRKNINLAIPLDTLVPLTHNFRLSDNSQCIPTFNTSTISRKYTLTLRIGFRCLDKVFYITCTLPLVILPRNRHSPVSHYRATEDLAVDPLPLYHPPAPDYTDSVMSTSLRPRAPRESSEDILISTPSLTTAQTSVFSADDLSSLQDDINSDTVTAGLGPVASGDMRSCESAGMWVLI